MNKDLLKAELAILLTSKNEFDNKWNYEVGSRYFDLAIYVKAFSYLNKAFELNFNSQDLFYKLAFLTNREHDKINSIYVDEDKTTCLPYTCNKSALFYLELLDNKKIDLSAYYTEYILYYFNSYKISDALDYIHEVKIQNLVTPEILSIEVSCYQVEGDFSSAFDKQLSLVTNYSCNAEEYLNLGKLALLVYNKEFAIENFNTYLELTDFDIDSLVKISDIFIDSGYTDDFIKFVDVQDIDNYPLNFKLRIKSRTYFESGMSYDVVELLENNSIGDDLELNRLLAIGYLQLGEYYSCINICSKLLKQGYTKSWLYSVISEANELAGKFDEAIINLNTLIRLYPNHNYYTYIIHAFAKCHSGLQNFEVAESYYLKLLWCFDDEVSEESINYFIDFQNFYKNAKMYEKAVEIGERIYKSGFSTNSSTVGLAVIYMLASKEHKAIELLDSIDFENAENFIDVFYNAALVYTSLKNFDEVIYLFEIYSKKYDLVNAIAFLKVFANAITVKMDFNLLAKYKDILLENNLYLLVLHAMNRFDLIVEEIVKDNNYKNDFTTIETLARAYCNLNQYKAAQDLLLDNYEIGETNAQFNYILGYAYCYDKKFTKALKYLEIAFELSNDNPNNFHIKSCLAFTYGNLGKFNKSFSLFNEILDVEPNEYSVMDELAQVYILKMDYDKAKELYETIDKNDALDAEIALNYSKLLTLLNEEKLAQKYLKISKDYESSFKMKNFKSLITVKN